MLNKEQIYQVIDFVVNQAVGYNVRVVVNSREEGLTRFANSEIHQNMFEDMTGVAITIQQGKKVSEIKTTRYDEEGLRLAVQETIDNLEFVPEGELELPLVESPEVLEVEEVNEELIDLFNIEERARLIKEGIDILDEGFKAFGALSYTMESFGYGNSKNVKRFASANTVKFSVLIDSDKGGSGYAEANSNLPDEIDITGSFTIAYDKAKMNQDPEQLEPGAYTVILEPLAVGEMVQYMAYMGFSAKSVQYKRSFLTGKLGELVLGKNITIIDDHTNEHTMTMPFDLEGYPRQKVMIIEDGVAKGLVYDTASAIKDGVETTGHSINMPGMGALPLHLTIVPGEESLQEIIANTEKGLLVTRFHYMNVVNPRQAILTALTRDGVFKIENGKLVGSVKNMRFTESMLDAFNNVETISSERQQVPSFRGTNYVPALKIKNFHFTGKTNV